MDACCCTSDLPDSPTPSFAAQNPHPPPSPLTSGRVPNTRLVEGTHAAAGGRQTAVALDACWLLVVLLLPPPWFPCHLGNWYSATACRSRAQGSRKGPKVRFKSQGLYVDRAHTVLFMSVLLSPLQHRWTTTDRSRTTSVSLDKFKFVPPSLDIARGLLCSVSRGSRRSVSRQHHTHTHTRTHTSVLTPASASGPLYFFLHLHTHTSLHPPLVWLSVYPNLYLRKDGSTSRLSALASHSILYFAPRLVHLAISLGLYTTHLPTHTPHTRTRTQARAQYIWCLASRRPLVLVPTLTLWS